MEVIVESNFGADRTLEPSAPRRISWGPSTRICRAPKLLLANRELESRQWR